MTKSTKRKIVFVLMAVLLLAICTSAVVTIVRFLKEPAPRRLSRLLRALTWNIPLK